MVKRLRLRAISGALALILVVAPVATSSGAWRGDDLGAADRAALESLAGQVLARLDAMRDAKMRRLGADIAVKRTEAAVEKAKQTAQIAALAVNEYQEGAFPQKEQTILSDLKLAESDLRGAKDRLEWSDKMLTRGVVSGAENMADKLALQKREIGHANAKTRLYILRQFSNRKVTTQLAADAAKAQAALLSAQADAELAKLTLSRANRDIADAELFEPEARALVLLDEAISRFDAGDSVKGREHVNAATKLWHQAQVDRASALFRASKKRIHAEADAIRSAK